MAWPHLAEHPEVGGEGEIGHRGVQAAAPGRVALPHLKIYVSTSYRVFFLTGLPLKMSLDWPPPKNASTGPL